MSKKPDTFQIKSPGDGVYRVSLVGADPRHAANTLFYGPDQVRSVDLPAGTYTALIEPVGSKRQLTQHIRLGPKRKTIALRDDYGLEPVCTTSAQGARPSWSGSRNEKTRLAAGHDLGDRDFTIGLSVDTEPGARGGWKAPEWPRLSQSHADGKSLAILLRRTKDWRDRPRWRLTIAVENDAVWRAPLPLFRSGLQLHFAPIETPTGHDFELRMAPRDPIKAALVASLEQLSSPNVVELVQASVASAAPDPVPIEDALQTLFDKGEDPWAAAAAALLLARHNQIKQADAGVRRLYETCPWLPDAAVTLAWAEASTPGPAEAVEARCFALIKAARAVGAVYFSAADALALEMLSAIESSARDGDLRVEAGKERQRWAMRSKGRMPTGAFLTWEDERDRSHNGQLNPAEHAILACGKLANGRIITSAGKSVRPQAGKVRGAPALERPITHEDDPHKGRFGGRAARNGFRLQAHFGRALGDWVQVNLKVVAPSTINPARAVELFLHDTFDPDQLTIEFVDGAATYSVLAWGGFTVGAWIEEHNVELELDLSLIKRAPRAVREL